MKQRACPPCTVKGIQFTESGTVGITDMTEEAAKPKPNSRLQWHLVWCQTLELIENRLRLSLSSLHRYGSLRPFLDRV